MNSVPDVTNLLNQRLEIASRRRSYTAVKVLVLYWNDGHEGFRDEGQEVADMFRQTFQYDVQEFAIPSIESQLHLRHFISGALIQLKSTCQMDGDTSLLIVHYGGHGDQDDDRRNGEERRSVWAAQASGPPTLEWYRIQEDIKTAGVDILLLLDCCFAAQAGRAREATTSNFEFLAAAPMGMKTPLPGLGSFTHALIKHIRDNIQKQGSVRIVDLHKQLLHRNADLYATPVYANLGAGQKSIDLRPFPSLLLPVRVHDTGGVYFQFKFWTAENLTQAFIDSLAGWLGESAPRNVTAIEVQSILRKTTEINNFVTGSLRSSQPLARSLEDSARQEVLSAWKRLSTLVETYNTEHMDNTQTEADSDASRRRLIEFIRTLEAENDDFSETLERNVLNSSKMKDSQILDEVLTDPLSTKLGIADQLQLRRIISSSEGTTEELRGSVISATHSDRIRHEYRSYGPYFNPEHLPDLEWRIALLAQLLSQAKNPKLLSLMCRGWKNERTWSRFVLEFEIPDRYQVEPASIRTLFSLIDPQKGTDRPSLDQRLRIAFMLTKGIQSWHSVNWLHQGISSHNVMFLTREGEKKPDYGHPFLQGFQFTRPTDDPSIGRASDEITSAIYRHPDRQGVARKGHTKLHDLYSLGVVLLEIGLWQRAIDIVRLRKGKPEMSADHIKSQLLLACSTRLDHYAGVAYRTAVQHCLDLDFGIRMDEWTNSGLATAFHERVVKNLAEGVRIG